MKKLCEFSTVEDFWRYFNHIPKPSEVFTDESGCEKRVEPVTPEGDGSSGGGKVVKEFSLFKKGIEPEWEDPNNQIGGEWFCRQQPMESAQLDMYWQNLVLGVIGNTIESSSLSERFINGVRVVDKGRNFPLFRFELWIRTKDVNVRQRLKENLLQVLTDGVQSAKKGHPTFEWKDHS